MPPLARFVRTPTALADRHGGLEWEPAPSRDPITWAEAFASAALGGWRLPSTAELMGFLADLPDDAGWTPTDGVTFWSATGSPFAPASRVRAVACEDGGRYAVVLLDKASRARRWAVRAAPCP